MRPVARTFASFLIAAVAASALPTMTMAQDSATTQTNSGNEDEQLNAPVPSRFGTAEADEAYGAFQRGLYITARNLALPRAEAGDPASQTLIAEIYARGLGVPVDLKVAEEWYRKAAAQGNAAAEFEYGMILLSRAETAEEKQTVADLMKHAADAGVVKAQFNYGQLLMDIRPGPEARAEAISYFEKAAEGGLADAQYLVGQYALTGSALEKPDEGRARVFFEKAARQGFVAAQAEYAAMLIEGVGGARDVARGFGWALQAATAGSAEAQGIVSQLYRSGIGVEPDDLEAAAWYVVYRRGGERLDVMEDFWLGLSEETQAKAIARANQLR